MIAGATGCEAIYGLDGTLLYRDNATTGERTDYIAMGGHSVGRMSQSGTFTWTHADHLGGASAATDGSGAITWRESYLPFGEVMDDPAANRDQAGFTGHIRDSATGLTYAQARYYNPVTARFLAPDPVGFADMGPGYFNRYAYTMNDPVNLVDPDGRAAKPDFIQDRVNQELTDAVIEDPEGAIDAGLAAAEGLLIAADVLLGGPSGEGIAPAIGIRAFRQSLKNGADDAAEGAASTLTPGPYARDSTPATSGRASESARRVNNRNGDEHGCHTCGARDPGRPSGNWTPDHQPPNALNSTGGPQRFYPHCARCSARQGAEVRNARRSAAPPPPPPPPRRP